MSTGFNEGSCLYCTFYQESQAVASLWPSVLHGITPNKRVFYTPNVVSIATSELPGKFGFPLRVPTSSINNVGSFSGFLACLINNLKTDWKET